jgi:hypothetical protein
MANERHAGIAVGFLDINQIGPSARNHPVARFSALGAKMARFLSPS